MSVGEIVGLAATTLLVGLLMGLWIGVSIRGGHEPRPPCRRDRIDAYARWLAARRSLSRASTSLVAAFRSMAAEPQAAANHALRRDEAQRGRAFWCEAMRKLDQAEAALVVQDFLFDNGHSAWADVDRVDAAALQVAINGTNSDVERLIGSLATTDERARTVVREAVTRLDRRRPGIVGQWARALQRWIAVVVDRWSEP